MSYVCRSPTPESELLDDESVDGNHLMNGSLSRSDSEQSLADSELSSHSDNSQEKTNPSNDTAGVRDKHLIGTTLQDLFIS